MTVTAEKGLFGRFKHFKERHHVAFEVAFFFAGFVFDYLLLHRIDSVPLLIHQGTYVTLLVLLIAVDHRIQVAGKEPSGIIGKIVSVRQWVIHFFLGTLFNAFMIFYFRSASGWSARVFISVIALALVMNEMPRFRAWGTPMRVGLWSFALTSYLGYLFPLAWHSLNKGLFFLAVACGAGATFGVWKLFKWFTKDKDWSLKKGVYPGLVIQGLLLLAYLLEAVPPVPLSLKYIGIFHQVDVQKVDGVPHYTLQFMKPPGLIAHALAKDASTGYLFREGDRAYAFASIFAPRHFHDSIFFAFDFDDPKQGWTSWGKPFRTQVAESQETGFRTYSYTTLSRPGEYRVRVLTEDGREIGREDFTVLKDPAPDEPRTYEVVEK
ncbi:MAG: DUF2914 domain-containing protein [Myxococcaceae bacterium]